jgi:hypothetical protein
MHAVYYRDRRRQEPVNDSIDGLPARVQASLDLQIDRHHVSTRRSCSRTVGVAPGLGERPVGRTFSSTDADDEPKRTTLAGGGLAKADPRQ